MKPEKLYILILIIVTLSFFYPLSIHGKFPIPADTIVGLYHPFRDLYSAEFPNGIPYKNSLITDPVRQTYPWRFLSVSSAKKLQIPFWNPYNFAGTPLLSNLQSAAFYPFNIFLILPDFIKWWSLLIILQPLLASLFMYLYLRSLKLRASSCFLGGFTYAFCGFSIAWLQWGTIGHVMLWLPLILLSVDRLFFSKRIITWSVIFIISLSSSMLAGHLQSFFYLFIVSVFYFLARALQHKAGRKIIFLLPLLIFCSLFLTIIQWMPTLNFILRSARFMDQLFTGSEGWFLPYKHLVQFIAPDYFGNPATLNYWGIWNYGEFIGYIGIASLIMAMFALFFRFDRKTLFFGTIFFLSLIFALPNWLSELPYKLQIPFLSSSQPTRLMFLTDFSLSVLAALGLDYFLRSGHRKKIIIPIIFLLTTLSILWLGVLYPNLFNTGITVENLTVTKNNLLLPTFLILASIAIILLFIYIKYKNIRVILIILLLTLTVFDLFRFAYKFTPFTQREYLFPSSSLLTGIKKFSGAHRVMATDARIFPPNFSIMYQLYSLDGYDPLYLSRYAELIAAMERNEPNIEPPFGYNRIITPRNYDSKIADLMGVKYVFSLEEIESEKLTLASAEGLTRVYENKNTFDRVFFVDTIYPSKDKYDSIQALFDDNIDLKKTAVVENWDMPEERFHVATASARIISYRDNEVRIETKNTEQGFLVFTDTYYPAWHARICASGSHECANAKIYLTNYNFRGIIVPPGEVEIKFYMTLL